MRAMVMVVVLAASMLPGAAVAQQQQQTPPNPEEGPQPNWPVGHFQIVQTRLGDTQIPVLLNTVNGAMWVMVSSATQKGIVWVPMTINNTSTPVALSPSGPSVP